jgi:hypothetical protein
LPAHHDEDSAPLRITAAEAAYSIEIAALHSSV